MRKISLGERSLDTEKMDEPTADPVQLINTVRQFALINMLFSASRKLIRQYMFPLMEPAAGSPYTFLDIGAGGCDTALWLVDQCKKKIFQCR
jgi:ubiquinone/menaquinone biosynthesis C-methylase UbiE